MSEGKNVVCIGIVGGGAGGQHLLEQFLATKLVRVHFVVDVTLGAPAMVLARKYDIPTFQDMAAAVASSQVDYVFEATGVPKVREILKGLMDPDKIVDSDIAFVLFDIINTSRLETNKSILKDITTIQEEIDHNTKSVSELLGTFTQLAVSLQILSYNAGIEAVKAGETGKGFGVVAFTLKDASEEAKEISKMITTLNKENQEVLKTINSSMEKLAN